MSISDAIQNKQLLSFIYKNIRRVVEPYTYGIDKKGHLALRAYQVSGGSSSGEALGWKFFHVDEIRSLEILEEKFFILKPDYRRNDSSFTVIRSQV